MTVPAAGPATGPGRVEAIGAALVVSYASAVWGVISGSVSIAVGVAAHSTALVGTGADVLADLASTAMLIWRFRQERAGHPTPDRIERRALVVASSCLLVVAAGLLAAGIVRLRSGDGADASLLSIVVAGVCLVVLPVLSHWKYRVAGTVGSGALRTDAHIGVVGATTAALTLLGLLATAEFGWTAADSVAALAVAVVAAATGVTELRGRAPHIA